MKMTHLILIQPDQTFSYQQLLPSVSQVLLDFQVERRLPDYIKADASSRNPDVIYSAFCWKDWVIALPDEPGNALTYHVSTGSRLTQRQLDVLDCLSQGLTGKQIAGRLNIHQRSVSLHISALKHNLDANTVAECVQKASRMGILKPGG
jgi:DNA-binding NarL/FixJ family response regulator